MKIYHLPAKLKFIIFDKNYGAESINNRVVFLEIC